MDVKQADILTVRLDAQDRLTVDGDTMAMTLVGKVVEQFAAVSPRHRIIAVETDRETSYNAYFQLQDAIVKAYRRLKCPPRIAETAAYGLNDN